MDKASIARYAVLVIAVINSVLNLFGMQTIPDDLTNNIVAVLTGVYTLYMGWKNNYLSRRGVKQKDVLQEKGLTN